MWFLAAGGRLCATSSWSASRFRSNVADIVDSVVELFSGQYGFHIGICTFHLDDLYLLMSLKVKGVCYQWYCSLISLKCLTQLALPSWPLVLAPWLGQRELCVDWSTVDPDLRPCSGLYTWSCRSMWTKHEPSRNTGTAGALERTDSVARCGKTKWLRWAMLTYVDQERLWKIWPEDHVGDVNYC